MTSNVFLDSSILIEPIKNSKVEFYRQLISNETYNCCINTIVVSEYLYKYLGLQGEGSPRSIESRKEIALVLQPYFISNTLMEFEFLKQFRYRFACAPTDVET